MFHSQHDYSFNLPRNRRFPRPKKWRETRDSVARGKRMRKRFREAKKRADGAGSRETRVRGFDACGRSRSFGCIALLASGNSSATSRGACTIRIRGRTLHNRERWTQSTVTRHARIFDVRHAESAAAQRTALYPELPKSKRSPMYRRYVSIFYFDIIFKSDIH